MHKTLKNVLPSNVKSCITYPGQKLNRFQIKDKINKKHKHNLIYYTKCPEVFCTEDYLGETGCRIIGWVADHTGKDKQSHLLKHALTQNHWHIDLVNMKIIDSSYQNNKLKWKISEALYIKQYRPSLNSQEQSVELTTFQIVPLVLLNHLGNYINFYHFPVILEVHFYSDNGLWNVRSKSFLLTKYVQASHNLVYHKTLCPKWNFQEYIVVSPIK